MDIGSRIRQVRGKEPREAFSQRLGIHAQTLYRYETGGRNVDAELIAKICTECGISSEWIIFGVGPMLASNSAAGAVETLLNVEEPEPTFIRYPQRAEARYGVEPGSTRIISGASAAAMQVLGEKREGGAGAAAQADVAGGVHAAAMRQGIRGCSRASEGAGRTRTQNYASQAEVTMVPLVDAYLSAGHGSFELSGDISEYYAFRSEFLMRKGQAVHMVLMRVDGDSMAPQIQNNDVVLIDQSQKELRPGKIYAVGVEDLVYLKKVDAKPGEITLYSINEDYAPLHIDTRGDQAENIRIIGRAVWWCRDD